MTFLSEVKLLETQCQFTKGTDLTVASIFKEKKKKKKKEHCLQILNGPPNYW